MPPDPAIDSVPASAIESLAAKWTLRADEIETTAKSYSCRAMDGTRMAYLKQAQRLRVCADQLRALIGGGDADQGA